jgi:hypothetical protein
MTVPELKMYKAGTVAQGDGRLLYVGSWEEKAKSVVKA